MRRRRLISFLYLLIAGVILLVTFRCNSNKPASSASVPAHTWLNTSDTVKYVGIEPCKKCHYDVYKSFIETGMGQSFAHASMKKSKGHFEHIAPLYDKYSDYYYQPFWRDTVMLLKEYRLKGKDTVFRRIEPVSYIIGSGHHTNSHMMDINGYVYQMPFTFYVQKEELDMPPGFEHGYNSRFTREIGIECMSCHNSYPGFVKGSVNKYTSIPEGINCERCHGPGSLHVAQKLLGKVVDIKHDTDFTIVNPRKLPFELQIDVCQRCHLQGDAVLKPGKTFLDFHPGTKLSDVMDIFMPTYENDEKGFLMAAHAQRMKKSQCFLQSNKKSARTDPMNCLSCHNPHISVKVTRQQVFIDKCLSCHKDAHGCKAPEKERAAKKDNCITCHMPRSSSVDIPHVTITDHDIRIVKEKPKDYVPGVGKFKGLECLNNSNPDMITIAKAYMYFYEKFEHKAYNLDSAFKYLKHYSTTAQPEAYICYYYLREDFKSVPGIATSKPDGFKDALTNYQVGKSFLNLNMPSQALHYFQAAANIEPYNLEYRNQLGVNYSIMNNFMSAKREFQFTITENPEFYKGWNGLTFISMAQNNVAEAKSSNERSLALDPDNEAALLNKIKLLIFYDDKAEIKKKMEFLLRKYPNSDDVKTMNEYLKKNKLL